MSIWGVYPNLNPAEFRALVAVAAQVLLESDAAAAEFSPDLLQQSAAASARAIEPLLGQADPTAMRKNVQLMLEEEELAISVCRKVLDQVRTYPVLADRVAAEYEARQQKMTGVEITLLAGALVILALRIKHLGRGTSGVSIDFEPANEAVKTFVAGLVKGIGLGSNE